jgi:L-2,4-diaminobutyrate decarboxylase
MSDSLEAAFDPDRFRALGHRVVDFLAEVLHENLTGEGKVRRDVSPEVEFRFWEDLMAKGGGDELDFLQQFARRSIQLHHPRYVGHQVCAPAPGAAVAGFVGELLNNGMAVYEMGPAATALERWVIEQTGNVLGLIKPGGFLTSGGTLAMLTALLAARTIAIGKHGADAVRRFSVIVSEQSHYCAARAAQVMGWGAKGVVQVPVDSRFKMRVDLLEKAYEQNLLAGGLPVVVVGSACSTSTGSYDDLNAIADFCERHALWFHVDAAHGGAVVFCEELKDRVAGIERADSVMLDFHKMLLTPALATALIFRDHAQSWAAFQQRADYLWDATAQEEWFNVGRRSFECTKLSMSLKIAAIWRRYGASVFAENVRRTHANARLFWRLLDADPRFETAVEPESNIVCFRLLSKGIDGEESDELHQKVRADVIASGDFYLVQTVLGGRVWLRTALMNPFTGEAHLRSLIEAVVESAKRAVST